MTAYKWIVAILSFIVLSTVNAAILKMKSSRIIIVQYNFPPHGSKTKLLIVHFLLIFSSLHAFSAYPLATCCPRYQLIKILSLVTGD